MNKMRTLLFVAATAGIGLVGAFNEQPDFYANENGDIDDTSDSLNFLNDSANDDGDSVVEKEKKFDSVLHFNCRSD